MIRVALQQRPSHNRKVPAWHAKFLAMLPVIQQYARVAFRHLKGDDRDDAIEEVIANCLVAYIRLVQLKRTGVAYPTVLTKYAISQVREGRRVGNHLNIREVLSQYAQRPKGFTSSVWTISTRRRTNGRRPWSKTTKRRCRSGGLQDRFSGLAGNPIAPRSANCRDIGNRALHHRSGQTLSRECRPHLPKAPRVPQVLARVPGGSSPREQGGMSDRASTGLIRRQNARPFGPGFFRHISGVQ